MNEAAICPHCGVACDYETYLAELGQLNKHDSGLLNEIIHAQVTSSHCPHCGGLIVYLETMDHAISENRILETILLYPRATNRKPVPVEVPAHIAQDYVEACLVLQDSPKASAALSRRCMQHIIREASGIRKKNLDQEITELVQAGVLPSHLSEELDAVRNIGNMAAHPWKEEVTGNIVPVEEHEAEWTLDVIESLFDHFYVQPLLAQKRRQALNEKLKKAGKPELKFG